MVICILTLIGCDVMTIVGGGSLGRFSRLGFGRSGVRSRWAQKKKKSALVDRYYLVLR